jgi:hypothetical protein
LVSVLLMHCVNLICFGFVFLFFQLIVGLILVRLALPDVFDLGLSLIADAVLRQNYCLIRLDLHQVEVIVA